MPETTTRTTETKNTFKVSCIAPGVLHKFVTFRGVRPTMSGRSLNKEEALRVANAIRKPSPNDRSDINMKSQLCYQVLRKVEAHNQWVEQHSVNLWRSPEEEKHYLKILVRAAILRQREEESTALSRTILSRNTPAATKQKQEAEQQHLVEGTGESTMHIKKSVSQSEAFDLDFVVQRLMEDIDIVYDAHGYKVTLSTFSQLNPWHV